MPGIPTKGREGSSEPEELLPGAGTEVVGVVLPGVISYRAYLQSRHLLPATTAHLASHWTQQLHGGRDESN